MRDLLIRATLAIAGSAELSILVKATIVLALTFAAARLARSMRASVRGLLLAATFGVLALLPLAAAFAPPVAVEFSLGQVSDPAHPPVLLNPRALGFVRDAGGQVVRRPVPAAPATAAAGSWAGLLRTAWAIGAAFFVLPIAATLWRLRRLRRCGLPWPHCDELIARLAADGGIRRPVDVLLHEQLAAPFTWGLWRPAIVLPLDAQAWSDTHIEHALVHELEHVRRMDWPIHLMARVVCSLYWCQPLAWTAWRRLCLESERACDDAVLGRAEGTAYAEQLVTLAQRMAHGSSRPLLAMANRSDLFTRVTAVLDHTQQRGRVGVAAITAVTAGALALVLGISPLRAAPEPALRILSQAPAADSGPAFEVASIKPNKSGGPFLSSGGRGNGRYVATNITPWLLIRNAFDLLDPQIIGAPAWLSSSRFDIEAKAPGTAGPAEMQRMMQRLLAERFKLATHKETRQLPVYALVPAGRDGKPAAGLKPANESGCALPGAPPEERPGRGGALPPLPCGVIRTGSGFLDARAVPLEQFARLLSNTVGPFGSSGAAGLDRIVLDRSGFSGRFDFELKFQSTVPPPAANDDRPSIFTALQEQLGLKLDPLRAPVEVLVIDHVEQPTED